MMVTICSAYCHHHLSAWLHVFTFTQMIYKCITILTQRQLPGEAVGITFKLSRCVAEIRNRMTKNKFKLSDSKTELFIASPRLSKTTLCIRTTKKSPSATIRNLGVVFDSAMISYIISLCKSLNFFLWNVSRIQGLLIKRPAIPPCMSL